MDNPEKTGNIEEKENISNSVGHHYTQTNTNNIRHEPSYKQLETQTNRTSFIWKIRKDITTRNIKGQQKTKKMSNTD
jgi:hypothetical protein